METFSALLLICAGNLAVTGEFPAQKPVTWGFGVFFDFRLNKRLGKQRWDWWFEMPSHPLWRHCNISPQISWTSTQLWGSQIERSTWNILTNFHRRLGCLLNHLFRRRSKKLSKLRVGIRRGTVNSEHTASNAENVSIWWRHHVWIQFITIVVPMSVERIYFGYRLVLNG